MPSFGYVVFCESLVNPNSLRFGPFGGPFCLPQVDPIQSSFATGAGNARYCAGLAKGVAHGGGAGDLPSRIDVGQGRRGVGWMRLGS